LGLLPESQTVDSSEFSEPLWNSLWVTSLDRCQSTHTWAWAWSWAKTRFCRSAFIALFHPLMKSSGIVVCSECVCEMCCKGQNAGKSGVEMHETTIPLTRRYGHSYSYRLLRFKALCTINPDRRTPTDVSLLRGNDRDGLPACLPACLPCNEPKAIRLSSLLVDLVGLRQFLVLGKDRFRSPVHTKG